MIKKNIKRFKFTKDKLSDRINRDDVILIRRRIRELSSTLTWKERIKIKFIGLKYRIEDWWTDLDYRLNNFPVIPFIMLLTNALLLIYYLTKN